MGSFTAGPLSVADAGDYVTYNTSVTAAMQQLVKEGKLQDVATLDDFMALSARIRQAVTGAAATARSQGSSEFTVTVPMTRSEHMMMNAMGPTLESVLSIATMRGTINTKPGPSTFTFMGVLGRGTFAMDA